MLFHSPEEQDPLEPIEREIIDWGKYHEEIFLRFSQVIDRLKEKLPRLRMVLRNRRTLNTYLQRIRELMLQPRTSEERLLIQKKAQNQIREIRSALAHCYTAIAAFEEAFDRTLSLMERIPEDNLTKQSTPITTNPPKSISEEDLLNELQKVHGIISGIEAIQQGVEYTGKTYEEDTQEKQRLGDILVEEGIITREQLNKALLYQKQSSSKEHLGIVLQRLGFVDDVTIAKVLAKQSGYPFAEDLRNEFVHSMALKLIPERLARQHVCMPLQVRGNTLRVAISNPHNLLALEDLKLASNCTLDIIVAPKNQILYMIRKYYSSVK